MRPAARVLTASVLFVAAACASRAAPPPAAPAFAATSCGGIRTAGARCGTVTVPEHRGAASGRTIPLRVVVLPAKDAHALDDAVFLLAGGPGQAATWQVDAPEIVNHALRQHRDLVFVDQRGTGGSHQLTCHFYGQPSDVQAHFADFMPIDRVRECRDDLVRDADLTQYTTANSIDDLEDVRQALGYARINLIGVSYGTRLAMEYVRAHAARVRAVVLYGAVSPAEAMPEHFGIFAQHALDGVVAECGAEPDCGRAFPTLREDASAMWRRFDRGPVTAQVMIGGRPVSITLTRDMTAETLRYLTYTSEGASEVPQELHRAAQGDFAGFAEAAWRQRRAGTFDGLYLAITCTEDVPFVSARAEEEDAPTYLGTYRLRQQRAACAQWPRGAAPAWRGQPVSAATPTLIVSGGLDPVTPPAFGAELRRTLPNSLQVIVPHGGHGLFGLAHLECVDRIEQAFVERGSVAGLDTSCVAGMQRPGFTLR